MVYPFLIQDTGVRKALSRKEKKITKLFGTEIELVDIPALSPFFPVLLFLFFFFFSCSFKPKVQTRSPQ